MKLNITYQIYLKILIENRQNLKYYAETWNHDTGLLRIGKMSTINKKATPKKVAISSKATFRKWP
jgi:hypothetical protein